MKQFVHSPRRKRTGTNSKGTVARKQSRTRNLEGPWLLSLYTSSKDCWLLLIDSLTMSTVSGRIFRDESHCNFARRIVSQEKKTVATRSVTMNPGKRSRSNTNSVQNAKRHEIEVMRQIQRTALPQATYSSRLAEDLEATGTDDGKSPVVTLLVLNVSMVCPVSFGLVDTTSELEIPSDDISSLPVEILIDKLVVFHCHCSSETGCVCLGVVTVGRLCGDTRWSPSVAVYFPLSLFKIFDFEQHNLHSSYLTFQKHICKDP